MANTTGDLNVDIGATLTKLDKALKDLGGKFDKANQGVERGASQSSRKVESTWSKGLTNIGSYIAGAFAISVIQRFATEAISLAGKAEGIEAAFKRLNNENLLRDLRRATQGTITDLELMRQAVRAQNFQIPLEKLATFFEFATKRSAQTGESVDYLVNSIIDGIGRKSTLVLDNLGISASRLQEEVKRVGDFGLAAGNIIQEEIGKAGEVALTSAQKIAQQTAALENQKAVLGRQLVPGYISLLDTLNDIVRTFSSMDGLMSGMASAGLGRGFTFFEGISDSAQETRMRKINVEFDKMVYNMKVLVAQQEAMEKGGGWMDEYWKSKQKESSKVKLTLDQAVAAQEKLMRLQQGLVGLNNGTITGPGNALANVTPEDLAGLQAFIDKDLLDVENLDAEMAEFFATTQTNLQNLSSASMFFGASLTNAFRQSMDEGADFGEVLGKMLEDVIKQLLAAAAAAFALSVIMASFGMGGFGLAKGASFSQLFTAGFGNMSGLGLSSSNLSGASGSSNKNMNINVTGRIKGNDIVLSNERSEINRIRERGF